jgi:hypothetical protein
VVARDGIELQRGVDTTQVIDFTFGEKAGEFLKKTQPGKDVDYFVLATTFRF